MPDNLTPEQLRLCMRKNKGANTKPELALRKLVWALGCRYRTKAKVLGRPDFVFLRVKVAVFVDGCFWHGCEAHFRVPETNAAFWAEKIGKNRARVTSHQVV